MLKKVIWATDGSRSADAAMPIAKALVQATGGELTVLHAVQVLGPHEEGTGEPMLRTESETRSKIAAQAGELSSEGVVATFEAVNSPIGAVAQTIASFADAKGADVIVVGTRGQTVLSGLLVGSVSMRLLHLSRIPVLAVPSPHAE
jgi:nucleotide-binding universal stress UspA family protein